MPDTAAWRAVMKAAHDWDGGPPVEVADQYDTVMREFAHRLGFRLDQPTLEAMLFGIAVSIGIAGMFEEMDHPGGGTEISAENTTCGIFAARYLIVNRLEGME